MLADARLRCGWRRKEAARILGVSPSYLFNLEAGRRCPSVTVARRLADGLALSESERALLLAAAVDDAGADHPVRRAGREAVLLDSPFPAGSGPGTTGG